MAYKQKGCSPITAKLKRTTKGGMVQDPLLNVGSVLKMKGDLNKDSKMSGYESARQNAIDKSTPSPAKQGSSRYNKRKRKVKKQDAAEFSKKRDSDIQRLTSETNAMQGAISRYESKSGGKAPESDYNYLNKSKAKLKDRKASAAGDAGWAADDAARKNKTNQYAPKNKKDSPKKGKITGAIGSDLRRQQYKERGWAFDDTTKKKKAKTIGAKAVQIKTEAPSTKLIETKPKVKEISKAKANKLARAAKAKDNKLARAARVRAKGEAALASGNKRKALRLKRREERIKKRAAKK